MVPKSVPSKHENRTEYAELGADGLEVIADLLADLSESERREVIADLSPDERVAIARILTTKRNRVGHRDCQGERSSDQHIPAV